ncbi:MAG: EAL domain-containing protein, partial [Gammaproteobacteria bacterium]|nr:EAL domain-containing protein [Gammaproteobacteria bacterium]
NAMAVDKIEKAREVTEDYQFQLERLNKQLTESSRELEYLSLYDNLTSLPNRSLFRDRLSQHITAAERHNKSIGLLLIDLNNFKEINETMGHDKGDSLLKKITQRFLEQINTNETIARLGGDEFVLILPDCDQQQTLQRGNDLLQLLEAPFKIDHTEIAVSASIGATLYPEHGEDIGTLLGRADQAMYMAKENKRGISLYNPADDRSSLGQLTMTADLRKALEEQQFEVHYQPKLNMKTMQVDSVEALGRWSNPQRGRIPPNIFIHALEQAGMIDRYTYWLIETVQSQIALWHGKGFHLKIAINISTQTLVNPDFITYLEGNINDPDIGNHILFEITENLFLSEYDRLSDVLLRIRQLGISLSIDDFGTGYSSLSRLKKLPVSELKIDQSFVRDMNSDADDEAIVRSTIDLAHNLGLTVVAEGIETEAVFRQLVALGCDVAQGYLIGKPMPVDLFDDYIQQQLYKKIG